METEYIVAFIIGLIIAVCAVTLLAINNQRVDLKSTCCAECIKGFQPQFAASPYCINKADMSAKCIDYLGIKDVEGVSTAQAYSEKCK